MEITPAAAARAPFFEPDPVREKKRAHSTGVRTTRPEDRYGDDGSDVEMEEGSTDSLTDYEDDEDEMSIDSEGSISDSWDSDTEWDEERLVKANERKYWNR